MSASVLFVGKIVRRRKEFTRQEDVFFFVLASAGKQQGRLNLGVENAPKEND